ncbi:hypothetical protein PP742_gp01 [Alcaligenes phage vB_Af_QDWS595]|uniref:Uncharacterized protein n=1 Tax=Alcaligenes phage vB_Af_QDWS595 TaxID=2877946 RepID=A0AAE8Y296_9CAUD|nr:hypothetical protein PP742_gp01 [Alcaligenes phage vB_Af_QDWS595]UCR75559.1 hypothetical protein vBAfaPQDWS595_01 [Alcaligenes phage vB_Af_QDWS595]
MASLRMSVGSVLNTVVSAASTVTTTLDTITTGVGMLSARVNVEATKQETDLKLELHDHIDVAISRHSMLKAERKLEERKFIDQSANHSKFFEEALDTYTKLLKGDKDKK